MHPFPCSALLTCFGSARESAHFDPAEPCGLGTEVQKAETTSTICGQPSAKITQLTHPQGEEAGETYSISGISNCNSGHHVEAHLVFAAHESSAEESGHDALTVPAYIPRPSIIGVPKEQQDEKQVESHLPTSDNGLLTDNLIEDSVLREPSLVLRNIMAEPDCIDEDNPELIRPQKLINPVKSSRNHQDLHRELRMNQKRGLAPQNKPELQKVMERRKRDQVIKQQKEEEAQKKKSDLEIELLKRQQKLEQLELEKQKIQEEQENAPEFVKVKGNLRRTVQEATEAHNS